MSRGSPTFTDRSRAMSLRSGRSLVAASRGKRLGDGEVAIGAVRNHRLTWLKTELGTIELYRDHVRLERYQVSDAADLGIGPTKLRCPPTSLHASLSRGQPFRRRDVQELHSCV